MRHYEDDESQNLWRWAQYVPELRESLYHVPNGGRRNAREAKRFRSMGVRPGVSDYHLPVPRGAWHGLWIELKAPFPRKFKVTDDQRAWLANVRRQGSAAFICRGWVAAKQAIEWYLALPPPEIVEFNPPSLGRDIT